MRDDEELVLAARSGEPDAFGPLAARWFDRCWEIAWRILHDRDLAADVAQDTLLTAWQQLDRLDRPASFGGWVSRIARNRALDRLERERRAVPTGDHDALEPAAATAAPLADPETELDRAGQHDLVWAAAAALGERDASILDLHLRHGLEPAELAEELGVTPNNAHQLVFRLRKRLGGAIRAWIVWHGGTPNCVVLGAELAAAGATEFGRDVVRLVDAHVATCELCERTRVTAPAAMFSAVPLVLAPAGLREQVMAALAAAGVPVGDAGRAASVSDAGAEGAMSGPATPDDPGDALPGAEEEAGRDGATAADGAPQADGRDDVGDPGAGGGDDVGDQGAGGGDDASDHAASAEPVLAGGPPWGKLAAVAALMVVAAGAIWLVANQLDAPVVVDELLASPLDPVVEADVAPEDPFEIDLPPPGDMRPAPPVDDEAPAQTPADDDVAPAPPPDAPSPEPAPPTTDDPAPGGESPGTDDPDRGEEPDDPEPPRIIAFTEAPVVDPGCRGVVYQLTWETDNAEVVTLTTQRPDAERPVEEPVDPRGDVDRCEPRGTDFLLTATNDTDRVSAAPTPAAPAG